MTVECASARSDSHCRADQVLVAVGRKPRDPGLRPRVAGTRHGPAAPSQVDEQCRTSMRNVWAIGDLTGEPMLAHRGMAQGEMVAEIIAAAGAGASTRPRAIPAICFTDPEVVSVGLVAGRGQRRRRSSRSRRNFRSRPTAGAHDPGIERGLRAGRGAARQPPDPRLAGGGRRRVGTGDGVRAVDRDGRALEDVAGTIHAHPTLGEAVQEAALRALGQALHI